MPCIDVLRSLLQIYGPFPSCLLLFNLRTPSISLFPFSSLFSSFHSYFSFFRSLFLSSFPFFTKFTLVLHSPSFCYSFFVPFSSFLFFRSFLSPLFPFIPLFSLFSFFPRFLHFPSFPSPQNTIFY